MWFIIRAGAARGRYRYAVPQMTGDGWQTDSLTARKLDARLIDELFERIAAGDYRNINSVLIVRDDKLVVEEYFDGLAPVIGATLEQEPDWVGKPQSFDRDTVHTLQSATKSVTSILIGIAIDRQLITGADERISSFFPEFTGKDNVRLKHFLSMTAGLEWNEDVPFTDPRNDCERMNHSRDPIRLLLERPSVAPPGSKFAYNSAISLSLGEIVHRTSKMPVDEFAQAHLFEPLGITSHAWKGRFSNGLIHTGGGLYLRPRDMAKIGCMMLNDGRWQGKQIVSAAWVRESTRQQAPDKEYGYQWWRAWFKVREQPHDCFYAGGYGGQFMVVFPDLRLVVVSTGWNPDRGGQLFDMLQRYVLPAAT